MNLNHKKLEPASETQSEQQIEKSTEDIAISSKSMIDLPLSEKSKEIIRKCLQRKIEMKEEEILRDFEHDLEIAHQNLESKMKELVAPVKGKK